MKRGDGELGESCFLQPSLKWSVENCGTSWALVLVCHQPNTDLLLTSLFLDVEKFGIKEVDGVLYRLID